MTTISWRSRHRCNGGRAGAGISATAPHLDAAVAAHLVVKWTLRQQRVQAWTQPVDSKGEGDRFGLVAMEGRLDRGL
jgi:hypothetical protein